MIPGMSAPPMMHPAVPHGPSPLAAMLAHHAAAMSGPPPQMQHPGMPLQAPGAPVPLGLFRNDGMAHISGILYSSVASFGKARALGPDGDEFNFQAGRERNGHERISIITKKSEYNETLTDGLRYFSNPFAATRLDAQLFRDDGIKRYLGEKDGKMLITCSPEGDLDWRQVIHLVPKQTQIQSG